MNNLTKTAKTLDKICHVVQVILKVAAITCAVALVIMLLVPPLFGDSISTYMSGTNSLDFGSLDLELTENAVINFTLGFVQGLIGITMGFVVIFIAIKFCQCIRAILHPMTLGQPFDNGISNNLKKLSNLTIWMGIATNLTMIADGILTVFVYNLGDMMNPEVVSHIGMNIEPDLSFLLTFGILRLLSYVFSYGEELQKLSDETV